MKTQEKWIKELDNRFNFSNYPMTRGSLIIFISQLLAHSRKEYREELRKKINEISEKTTRGYLDSSDDWIEGYRLGRVDVKSNILILLEEDI